MFISFTVMNNPQCLHVDAIASVKQDDDNNVLIQLFDGSAIYPDQKYKQLQKQLPMATVFKDDIHGKVECHGPGDFIFPSGN